MRFLFRPLLLSLLFFFTHGGRADEIHTDSIEASVQKATSDTARFNALCKGSEALYRKNKFRESFALAVRAMELAQKLNDKRLIGKACYMEGVCSDGNGDFDKAISLYNQGLEELGNTGYESERAKLHLGIGNAYDYKGNHEKALEYYISSLRLRETIRDSLGIASCYMGIANIYSDLSQYDQALSYYEKSLSIKQRLHDQIAVAWLYQNIGSVYKNLKDFGKAIDYYNRSIEAKKALGDQFGLTTTYSGLGDIYLTQKDFVQSLKYFRMCYSIRLTLNDPHQLASVMGSLGGVYTEMGEYKTALHYIDSSLVLARQTNSRDILRMGYFNKSQALFNSGNYKEAFEYHQRYSSLSDSILSANITSQMNEMNAKYESDKKEHQIALQSSEISRGRTIRTFMLAFCALILLLAIVLFRGYRNKRRTNELLEKKNELIQSQKLIVEEKNKDITDSIQYAKRIQEALLPSDETRKRLLPDSFIFYKPKDIVSGDFYMLEQWGKEIIVAAVDCTGHGVPGAFMSFMAYSLFNEAVNEHGITQPGAILNEMRRGLSKSLHRKESGNESVKDGMDIAICSLDLKAGQMFYSGAFNPLWILKSGSGELLEIRGDKQPVGLYQGMESKPFTNHIVPIEKNDVFYIFSDGFADQFGGPKGKKFKYKALQDLLLANAKRPMSEQKKILEIALRDWRGDLEQVDDILIIGVRI